MKIIVDCRRKIHVSIQDNLVKGLFTDPGPVNDLRNVDSKEIQGMNTHCN